MTTEERCADAIAREARRTVAAGIVFAALWVLLAAGLAAYAVSLLVSIRIYERRDH